MEAAEDCTTSSEELVFHFTEETDGDFDRLQREGIVLIEMNIIIFSPTVFFLRRPLRNQTNKSGATLCSHRCNNKRFQVMDAASVLWFLDLRGKIMKGIQQKYV